MIDKFQIDRIESIILGVIPPVPGAPAFAAPGLQGPVRGVGGPGFNQMAPVARGLPPGMRMPPPPMGIRKIRQKSFESLISIVRLSTFRSTRNVIPRKLNMCFLLYILLFSFVHLLLFCHPSFCMRNKKQTSTLFYSSLRLNSFSCL